MHFGEQVWRGHSEEMSFETVNSKWSHVNLNEKNGKSSQFEISQFFEELW